MMTTTTDKATPRPWTYHANYIEVSNEHGDHSLYAPDDRGAVSPETRWANARFVVQAVNAHDDLVEALTWMVNQFEDYHDADLEPHQVEQLDGWRAAMDVLDGKSWTPPKAEEA